MAWPGEGVTTQYWVVQYFLLKDGKGEVIEKETPSSSKKEKETQGLMSGGV